MRGDQQVLDTSAGTGAAPGDSAVVEAVLGASRVLVAIAARSLADLAEEVTVPQYRALVVLASQGPQRVLSLAEALAVTPSTATRMCDRLVRKGLLRRRASRTDRREVRLTLTPAGQSLVDQVTRRRRAEISRILAKIPRADQETIVEMFDKLADAAGEVPGPAPAGGWDL
ncbi:MAG: MarR family winged helix-turn-helix transcriptional regulator [Actinomycetota bacterium]|nr:MarR family winged helix-turn-helix transcriptional regulator [Actinomycetota bacterium]